MRKRTKNELLLTLLCLLLLIFNTSPNFSLKWLASSQGKLEQQLKEDIEVVITWTNFSSPKWKNLSHTYKISINHDRLSNNGEIFLTLSTLIANPRVRKVTVLTLDGLDISCLNIKNNKVIIYNQSQFTSDLQTTSMGVETLIRYLPIESEYLLYLNDDMIMNPTYKISFPHRYPTFYWFESKMINHSHQFVHNTLYVLSQDFNLHDLVIPNHRYHILNFKFLSNCLTMLVNRYGSLLKNKVRNYRDIKNGGSFYPIYVCQMLNLNRDSNLIEVQGIELPKYWRDYRSTFLSDDYDFLCLQEMHKEPEAFKQMIKVKYKTTLDIDLEKCGFTKDVRLYINAACLEEV